LCLREDAARLPVHGIEADWALAVVHGLVRRCVGLPEPRANTHEQHHRHAKIRGRDAWQAGGEWGTTAGGM